MVQQNELITLLVGFGVVLYIIINRHRLRGIPDFRILFISLMILFAGWILTIVEGFFLESLFNALEHLCYAVSALLIALWCWVVFIKDRGAR